MTWQILGICKIHGTEISVTYMKHIHGLLTYIDPLFDVAGHFKSDYKFTLYYLYIVLSIVEQNVDLQL